LVNWARLSRINLGTAFTLEAAVGIRMTRIIIGFAMTGAFLFGGHDRVFGESLFWTIQADSHIYRSQLDGTDPQVFLPFNSGEYPTGLAVDSQNGYLYWALASPSGNGHILRTKLGSAPSIETVATTSYGKIAGLALDVGGGYVYWTVPTAGVGVIQRANLTSHAVSTLFSGLSQPNGVCVDYDNHKLLWTESGVGRIGKSDLDGTHEESAFSGRNGPQGIAIDRVGHCLYWTEAGGTPTGQICRGSIGASFLTGLGDVFGLDINQRDHQAYWSAPTGSSPGIYRAPLDGSSPIEHIVVGAAAGYIAVGVPEPSCLVLAATGLCALLARWWPFRVVRDGRTVPAGGRPIRRTESGTRRLGARCGPVDVEQRKIAPLGLRRPARSQLRFASPEFPESP
jgi:hypothetical protein